MRVRLACLAVIMLLSGCGNATPGFAAARASSGVAALAARDAAKAVREANAPFVRRDPALVEEKYEKMAESAFSFFRGSAYLYYADVRREAALATAIRIPLQGDLHLENLGTYRTAAGAVAFDLNDFDEAFTGPYTWELARLAVSLHLAAEAIGVKKADELTARWLDAYARHLAALNRAALARPLTAGMLRGPAADAIEEAERASREDFLDKLTKKGAFKLGKKLRAIPDRTAGEVAEAVAAYARDRREPRGFFAVKDAAARVAGTASIGRYRYVARVEGPTASADDDVLLELKEEAAPVAAAARGNQAERVRKAYAYFLPGADPYLGTARLGGLDFLVREWSPAKNDVALVDLDRAGFEAFLETVALVVARAHARSGKAAAIVKEAKAPAIADFAARYAEQVRADHAAFTRSR